MKKDKIEKIRNSVYKQLNTNGYATIVQTYMDMNILDKNDYENWRKGQIPYLEKVCKCNLNKLTNIVKEVFKYASELELKKSYTFYKKYGKGEIRLRFSKSGIESIERRYATHFLFNNKSN